MSTDDINTSITRFELIQTVDELSSLCEVLRKSIKRAKADLDAAEKERDIWRERCEKAEKKHEALRVAFLLLVDSFDYFAPGDGVTAEQLSAIDRLHAALADDAAEPAEKCGTCGGSGEIRYAEIDECGNFPEPTLVPCFACNGTGGGE